MKYLTLKEKKLIDSILNGSTYNDSYRMAGYAASKMSRTAIDNEVVKILKRERIVVYMGEQRAKLQEQTDITFEKKMNRLWEIAQEGTKTYTTQQGIVKMKAPGDAIRAIAELNKMQGHYALPKVENKDEMSFDEAVLRLAEKSKKDHRYKGL